MCIRNFGRHALVFMVWFVVVGSVVACQPDSPTEVLYEPTASASLVSKADRYSLTYLEVPTPFGDAQALDVSQTGTAVGWAYGGGRFPVRWTRTGFQVLPHPEPLPSTGWAATSISPDGTRIAGGGVQGVLLWREGVLENLGLPPGARECYDVSASLYRPPQVNDAGQVLVNCLAESPQWTLIDASFFHDAGGWTRIGSPNHAVIAEGLSEDGSVVGWWEDYGAGDYGGFLWKAGQFTDLGEIWPTAVNDRGQMIVNSYGPSLWTKGNREAIPGEIGVGGVYAKGSLSDDGVVLGWYGLWDGATTVLLPSSPLPGRCRALGFSSPKWIAGFCGTFGRYPPFKPALWSTK